MYLEIAEVVGISPLDVINESPEGNSGSFERISLLKLIIVLQRLKRTQL
jgi:hypothetical protein